jgi:hypothetical protein
VAQPRQTVTAERVRRSLLAKTDWRGKEPSAVNFQFQMSNSNAVIASEAKQSRILPQMQSGLLRRLRSSQ